MKHELITLLNDHAAMPTSDAYQLQSGTAAQTAYRDRLACWSLRILSGAGGMPSYLQPERASLVSRSELLAVPELADVAASSHAVRQAFAAAVLRLGALNQTAGTRVAQDSGMLRTVNWLAQGAGLDPLERDIFEFAVAARAFTPLRCALASWSAIGHGEAISALAGVLQVPEVCGDTERSQWADVPTLTPALIDRLAVLHDRATAGGAVMDAALCRHWLQQRLPGKATRNLRAGHALSAAWNPQMVNASADLVALAQGIARSGTARILLHGAPGTGKTAYVHELARRLDRPATEQRAPDLLSAWVGDTEQRIAQAFATALQDGAVLFLDEADNLLADRAHAVRQWEVSQVNELLEHLGEFEGVVVLATNRLSALDNAVLRWLDVRIFFDALQPEQVGCSFVRLCKQRQLDGDESTESLVVQLSGLTPSDFALLARRPVFAPFDDAQALALALQQEAAAKPDAKPSMGFWPTRQAASATPQAGSTDLAALL